MATDPLAFLRSALEEAINASSLANRNLSLTLQTALDAAQRIDIGPAIPVLRIARPDNLQELLDGSGVVYVPKGKYLVRPDTPLNVRSRTLLVMHPDAQLIMQVNNLPRYKVLHIFEAQDVQVIGGLLLGDRLEHDYSSGGTHEWGMGLHVQRSQRVHIRDMECRNFAGDGFQISGQNLVIENSRAFNNRRQGMSIFQSRNVRVLGGEYSDTGKLGDNPGTKPMAGIDVEPDADTAEDLIFDGVTFRNNQSSGLLAWSNADAKASILGMHVINCTFEGSPNGLHASSPSGMPIDITALRNSFTRHKGAGVFAENRARIVVGSDLEEDANTFVSMSTRAPTEGAGLMTRYDIQTRTNAVVEVGFNRYR